jgi:hypothetical protein
MQDGSSRESMPLFGLPSQIAIEFDMVCPGITYLLDNGNVSPVISGGTLPLSIRIAPEGEEFGVDDLSLSSRNYLRLWRETKFGQAWPRPAQETEQIRIQMECRRTYIKVNA